MTIRPGRLAWLGLTSVLGCNGETLEVGTGVPEASNASEQAEASVGTTPSSDGGPTILASEIQQPPTALVSDGTSLFWVSNFVSPGGPIQSMPVTGGPISTIVPGQIGGVYLAVDEVNLYYLDAFGIEGVPKGGGGSARLVSEADDGGCWWEGVCTPYDSFITPYFTVLGSNAYWLETSVMRDPTGEYTVKSAPLLGGTITTMAAFESEIQFWWIGVTDSTVFLGSDTPSQVASFPTSQGIPDGGGPAPIAGVSSGAFGPLLFSDTDAVECETNGSVLSIASDGTVTMLGTNVIAGLVGINIAVDDTYVYWLDSTMIGTVMRVPKTGGTATVIAHDTQPVAIAVDSNAIYWSDQGGNIMRLNK